MHALVTGARGTVGRALVRTIESEGGRVTRWDRAVTPIDRYDAMERFVREAAPDAVFHLAIASEPTGRDGETWAVNYEWTSELAWIARTLGVPFVFTSTAMVFASEAKGPFTITSPADASHGYGHEKRSAESRVFHQHPGAHVVRLGWQIASEKSPPRGERSNDMWTHLMASAREHGAARASTGFIPACSFVDETAPALLRVLAMDPGLFMVDQNDRWSFFEIACALAEVHGRPFEVVPTDDFTQDQRMLDPRLGLPPLSSRLPCLPLR